MDRIIFMAGDLPVSLGMLAVGAGRVVALLVAAMIVLGLRQPKVREAEAGQGATERERARAKGEALERPPAGLRQAKVREAEAAQRATEMEAARAKSEALERQLAGMLQGQYEMNARMQTMSEIFGSRTSDLMRSLNDRIDAQGQRVGQALTETNTKTAESLSALNERLAVIDRAQANMAELGKDMVSLQSILSNKQTRGAFGQGRMEAIITDHLPAGSFAFQYTLSNNKRPDCVVFMPNGGPKLVIDAKFPLEAWERVRAAQSE